MSLEHFHTIALPSRIRARASNSDIPIQLPSTTKITARIPFHHQKPYQSSRLRQCDSNIFLSFLCTRRVHCLPFGKAKLSS